MVAIMLGRLPDYEQRRCLAGAGDAVQSSDLIPAGEDLSDSNPLAFVEAIVPGPPIPRAAEHHRRVLALACTHPVDGVLFQRDHRARREGPTRRADRLIHLNELASLDPPRKFSR